MRPQWFRWAAVGFVAGFAATAPFAYLVSPWLDEAASLSALRRTNGQLKELLQTQDAALGAYYFLARGWSSLWGDSLASLRLLSALAFAATAAAVGYLGSYLDRRTFVAPIAVVLTVLLPGLAWSGFDARPTALVTLLATAVLGETLRATREKESIRWWAFVVVALAGWLQLTSMTMLLAVLVSPVRRNRTYYVGLAASVASVLPLTLVARKQAAQVAWLDGPALPQVYSAFVGRFGDGPFSRNILVEVVQVTSPIVAVVLAGLAVSGFKGCRRDGTEGVLAAWVLAPPAALLLMGWLFQPLYAPRYVAFTLPALALLAARGCTRLLDRTTLAVSVPLLALAVLLLGPSFLASRAEDGKHGENYLAAARAVQNSPDNLPVVYYRNAISLAVAEPAAAGGRVQVPDPAGIPASGTLWGPMVGEVDLQRIDKSRGIVLVAPTSSMATDLRGLLAESNGCVSNNRESNRRLTVLVVRCA